MNEQNQYSIEKVAIAQSPEENSLISSLCVGVYLSVYTKDIRLHCGNKMSLHLCKDVSKIV